MAVLDKKSIPSYFLLNEQENKTKANETEKKIKTSNRKQRMKTSNERMETRLTYNCAHLRMTN